MPSLFGKVRVVGEVSAAASDSFEFFVYPEAYPLVRLGSLVVADSEGLKPVGVVSSLAHRVGRGTFTPLRRTREELAKAYPDIDEYLQQASTAVIVGYVSGVAVSQRRAAMPRVHDLVYLAGGDFVASFLKPSGRWSFDFIEYLAASLPPKPLELLFRDFVDCHAAALKSLAAERRDALLALSRALVKSSVANASRFLVELEAVMR